MSPVEGQWQVNVEEVGTGHLSDEPRETLKLLSQEVELVCL